ncbi:MAG: hypothetical protein M1821_007203 [Bathelium mastoideum]|nr:MAG: hypothetical protein M1821_007203 [Bathelium mastoideum]
MSESAQGQEEISLPQEQCRHPRSDSSSAVDISILGAAGDDVSHDVRCSASASAAHSSIAVNIDSLSGEASTTSLSVPTSGDHNEAQPDRSFRNQAAAGSMPGAQHETERDPTIAWHSCREQDPCSFDGTSPDMLRRGIGSQFNVEGAEAARNQASASTTGSTNTAVSLPTDHSQSEQDWSYARPSRRLTSDVDGSDAPADSRPSEGDDLA